MAILFPDFNPIENLWGIIKDCLNGMTFSSMNSLNNKLNSLCKNIEEDTVKRLLESIKDKMDAWMKLRGALANH